MAIDTQLPFFIYYHPTTDIRDLTKNYDHGEGNGNIEKR